MNEKEFAERLSSIRENHNLSARKLSKDLQLNPGYINKVENKMVLPSMQIFFQICDYFKITPAEFFGEAVPYSEELRDIIVNLQKLDKNQFDHIAAIINALANKK